MRVTESEVRNIFDSELDSAAITMHIKSANLLTNEIAEDYDVSEERLSTIELYLAAHFATVQAPLVTSESVGSASYTYERTNYMDMAIALDPTGQLDPDNPGWGIYVPDGR